MSIYCGHYTNLFTLHLMILVAIKRGDKHGEYEVSRGYRIPENHVILWENNKNGTHIE